MKFETLRYGTINVQEEDIINFNEGLLGFPNAKRFAFIDEETAAPFRILQSLDVANLAFVVIDPLVTMPKYHFKLKVEDIKVIEAKTVDNLSVYCIVNLSKVIQESTINLQGPLVINNEKKLAHQFVLFDENYSVSEKLINPKLLENNDEQDQNILKTAHNS